MYSVEEKENVIQYPVKTKDVTILYLWSKLKAQNKIVASRNESFEVRPSDKSLNS